MRTRIMVVASLLCLTLCITVRSLHSATSDGASEPRPKAPSKCIPDHYVVELPDGSKIEYVVDALNRRVGKRVNGKLVQSFLYEDELRPVAELDGGEKLVSRFIYGSRINVPELMEKGGKTFRIISDHLGSPRLVVDAGTGEVVQRMDYDEFGIVLRDTNPGFQPFGFAGGLYDRDTKLLRFGARDYDPVTGRWVARDPVLFRGGQANLFAYALNDPQNRIDPSGLNDLGTLDTETPPGFYVRDPRLPSVATDSEGGLFVVAPWDDPAHPKTQIGNTNDRLSRGPNYNPPKALPAKGASGPPVPHRKPCPPGGSYNKMPAPDTSNIGPNNPATTEGPIRG